MSVVTEFVLPPSIIPNEAEWSLLDFSGLMQSPLSGTVRTISRGQRWQVRVGYHDLVDDKRAALIAFAARLRGKANRAWITDPTYRQRGNFPAAELLTNSTFNGVTGWTAYGSAVLKAGNREMQIQTVGTASQGLYQTVTLSGAIAYVLRGCHVDGAGTAGVLMGPQWSNAGTVFSNITAATRGMLRAAGVSNAFAGWTVYAGLLSAGGAAIATGQVGLLAYSSLSRCMLVVNPSAAACFTSCLVDAMDASQNGVLLAGDKVEINGEFKTVTSDLHSASDGSGQLMFEPAMRTPIIPDNSPVVVYQPMMRGILAEDIVTPSRPGTSLFSDFAFTFVEA